MDRAIERFACHRGEKLGICPEMVAEILFACLDATALENQGIRTQDGFQGRSVFRRDSRGELIGGGRDLGLIIRMVEMRLVLCCGRRDYEEEEKSEVAHGTWGQNT